MNPGINSETFKIKFEENYFERGDILNLNNEVKVKVIKTYPFNWWRQFLYSLGIPFTSCKVIKVKSLPHENNS